MATFSVQTVQPWGDALRGSLQELWYGFVNALPELLGAFLILVLGWLIAIGLGKLVTRVLRLTKVDRFFDKLGVHQTFTKVGSNMKVSDFLGGLVRWFLILVAVVAAADVLDLAGVTEFLTHVLLYIPNVVVAIVILLAAIVIGNFAKVFVKGTVKAAGLMSANTLALLVKWIIIMFAVLAALLQLGIASSLVQTIVIGVVGMLALAGGLAFGLGGKDIAREILEEAKRQIKNNGKLK